MTQPSSSIPYGKHSINADDIDAVVDVLEHHFLTQGAKVPAFEQALCHYTGAKYCTAVNSATSGLHVACLALGVGVGDCVWTSPNSFAASANCALYCGASVDFVDINPCTRNICEDKLEEKLLIAQKNGSLPKAIVVVHFAGATCNMPRIAKLCEPLDIAIIEDAAHALGGQYSNIEDSSAPLNVGGGQYSDLAVFSFHPVKSITTAEGGAIVTNKAELYEACQLYAKHGITRDPSKIKGENHGPWYYQQLVLGYNYRLSDLQAALGISQLSRLDTFVARRRELVARYLNDLADLPLRLPLPETIGNSAWHLFMVELTKHCREAVYKALHEKGIAVNVHYIPIPNHPYYRDLGFASEDYANAHNFYNNALTLPLYMDMSDAQQSAVINALKEVLQ